MDNSTLPGTRSDIELVPTSETENGLDRVVHGWKWAIAYFTMLSTTFLFALNSTIVASIQPPIINDLGHMELLPWLGTGFALGCIAILPWSKAYNVFNVKYLYLFNILLFEAGSAICGAAPNMTTLIFGRVITGVGGSGMFSGALTYVYLTTNETERRSASLLGSTVVWGIGSVLGLVVGGAFAITQATWRWGFYMNLVVGGVFAPAYLLLLPTIDSQTVQSLSTKCHKIDWINTVIFLASTVCLAVAITFGGVVFSFKSGTMIALWVSTGVLLTAFIFTLKHHPFVERKDRLYPAHSLGQSDLLALQILVFPSSGIVLTMMYYIPLYFQFALGVGPLDAGLRLLPLIISMVFFSMVTILLLKTSHLFIICIGGPIIMTIGCSLMCTVNEDTDIARVYVYSILIGAGAAASIVSAFEIVQWVVASEEVANAVAAMTISQVLGMLLCLTISGTVFHTCAIRNIAQALPNIEEADLVGLISGRSSKAFAALSPGDQAALLPELVDALKNVWILCTVAGGFGFIIATWVLE